LHIYKSLIKPVVTCGCETWVLKDIPEQQLSVCKESNGEDIQPNKNQDGCWRIRTNEEIDLLIKHTVRYIKAQRIR